MSLFVFGNRLDAWVIALLIGILLFLALHGMKMLLLRRLYHKEASSASPPHGLASALVSSTHSLLFMALGAYAGSHWLVLPAGVDTGLAHGLVALLLLQTAHWGDVGTRAWLHRYRVEHGAQDAASTTSLSALGFIARTTIWLIVALMVLANFGVNITTLVASLGIGGIAVALAIQNVLGDLFSSLSILLDKPFVVGDTIAVDGITGAVEYVGMKTTRLRSIDGEQIVFSNSDLLKSRIHNYRRMQTRRAVFGIGISYEIGKRQLTAIPAMLREIVEAQPNVHFERAHFKSYGAASIDFEIAYTVDQPDTIVYLDTQQAINLALFERFADEGIRFAYPARLVQVATPDGLVPQATGASVSGC